MDEKRTIADLETPEDRALKFELEKIENSDKYVATTPNILIEQKRAAGDLSTSKETLSELAKIDNLFVKYAVGANCNTPEETLSELAECEGWYTKLAVAGNSNTPKEALLKLTEDKHEHIREVAFENLKKQGFAL